jgi:hypothetical protein
MCGESGCGKELSRDTLRAMTSRIPEIDPVTDLANHNLANHKLTFI